MSLALAVPGYTGSVPLTYSAVGLPAGLNISPQTGVISGIATPGADSAGPYTVTVAVQGGSYAGTQTFTWNVAAASLAAVSDKTNVEVDTVSLQLVGQDATGALTYSADSLPAGLSVNAATGLISGTVTAGDAASGPYSVTVTATDPTGNNAVSQTFNWTVNPVVTLSNPGGQSSATGDVISLSAAATDAHSLTLTYSATGLPTGLSINSSTGAITGTIGSTADTGSPYSVTVTATDTGSNTASKTFAWRVGQVYLANPGIQNNGDSDSVSLSTSAHGNNGYTLSYAATGLPAGLSISSSTGAITGTLTSGDYTSGPYSVVVTATDTHSNSASQTFTWNVNALELADPGSQSNADGASPTLTLSGSGPSGDTLTYAAQGLPAGLYLNTSTGDIDGTITPQADLDSPYTVSVAVYDSAGNFATQSFAWTVTPKVTLTDPGSQSSTEGVSVSLSLSHTYSGSGTLAFSAAGLPAGLSINSSTGAITGTPTTAGVYATAINAGDGTYSVQDLFSWTVAPHIAITVPADQNNAIGDTVSGVTVSATDVASATVTFSATGLPSGLSINSSTGVISGTITGTAAMHQVVVTATNGTNSDSASFYWQVGNVALTNPGAQLHMTGDAVSLTLSAHESGSPTLTFSATGLPAGLSINSSTGVISGTITAPGSTVAVVTVSDGTHSASQAFAWTVTGGIALANPGNEANTDGDVVYLPLAATDPEGETLTYSASGLPSGLSINSSTGVISGTVGSSADTSSPYSVTVTATDTGSHTKSQSFTWTIAKLSLDNPGSQVSNQGDVVSLVMTDHKASGDTVTFSASGLPSGLSINSSTGVISGTISAAGSYLTTITASDGSVSPTQTFAWTVAPDVALSFIHTQNSVDGDTVSVKITAADLTGNALTYSTSGTLPSGLSINSSTGVISGTIGSGADTSSPYSVTVTATDGSYSASQTFSWAVAIIGLSNPGTQADAAGASVSLAMTGDGSGTLTYSASGLPSGLSINSGTGAITGTLGSSDDASSPYSVTVTVSDGTHSATSDITWIVNPRVNLFSPGDQSGSDDDVVSLQLSSFDGAGSSITYSASGLPSGLSIDSSTGLISGTIGSSADASSPYSVTLTADDGTKSATQTINWVVATASITLTVPADQFNLRGDVISAPVTAFDANGDSFTFSASGLPAGLSIDSGSGLISGTISSSAVSGSPFSVTVTATATGGSTASTSATFNWTVVALTLVNPGPQQSVSLSTVSLAMSTNNPGSATLTYSATGLPAGLSINATTGAITGTLSSGADTNSPYTTVVTVTGSTYSSVQSFTWTVNTVILANPGDQTSNDSQPVLLSLMASDSDAGTITYSATGLPTGLSINTANGLISGVIGSSDDTTGTYNVSVTAIDGSHSATQHITWTINPLPALSVYSPGDQSNLDSDPVFVPITAVDPFGSAVSFSASGLPSGLTINPTSGIISGTIGASADTSSPYSVTITATDALGNSATDTFNWTVAALSFTNPGNQINSLDAALTLNLQAYSPAGSTLTYSETGLPTGLSLNTSTGVITGTPSAAGNYVVGITVSDGTHNVAATFNWQITTAGVGDPGTQTVTEGDTVSLQLAGVGPGAVTYSASGLPDGLTLDSQTGLISGTISAGDAANGPYTVDVSAISGLYAGSQTFTWNVNPKVSVTALDDQTSKEGQAVSLQVHATEAGATLAYSAVGLPQGVVIDPGTGLISGVIPAGSAQAGPYYVTVTVSDGTYSSAISLTWNVNPASAPAAPSVQAPASQTSYAGQSISLPVYATDAAGYAMDFNADNLPDGLSIDANTGIISGVIADDAVSDTPYEVSVTVHDGIGDKTTKTFLWTVTPATLAAQAFPISAVAGRTRGKSRFASFTTTDTGSPAENFVAAIDWGDGESSFGTVQGGSGSFTVVSDHNYAQWGNLPVSVDIWNVYGATNEVVTSGSANVSPNVTGGFQLGALAGQSASLTLAYFAAGGLATAGDFTATIAWGDGATTSATVTSAGPGLFAVTGSHSYATVGQQTATITVTDDVGVSQSTTSTIEVGDLYAGVPGELTLATFTGVSGTSYSVSIDWGDSHTGTPDITSGTATNASGVVTITGNHTFPVDSIGLTNSQYQVQVTVTGGATTLVTTVPVEVTRPPALFVLSNLPVDAGTVLTNQVTALFAESDVTDDASEFSASINWGDSTTGSASVQAIGGGLFEVMGSHSFSTSPSMGIAISVSQNWQVNEPEFQGDARVAPRVRRSAALPPGYNAPYVKITQNLLTSDGTTIIGPAF